jgi:hypothetical protein
MIGIVSGFDGWRGMWAVTLLLGTKTHFMYVIIVVSKIFWFTRDTFVVFIECDYFDTFLDQL